MGLPREELPKLRPTGDLRALEESLPRALQCCCVHWAADTALGVYLAGSGAGVCGNAVGAFPVALSSTHQHKMAQAGLLPPKLLPRDEVLLMIREIWNICTSKLNTVIL